MWWVEKIGDWKVIGVPVRGQFNAIFAFPEA
jgi:hypothetical protein